MLGLRTSGWSAAQCLRLRYPSQAHPTAHQRAVRPGHGSPNWSTVSSFHPRPQQGATASLEEAEVREDPSQGQLRGAGHRNPRQLCAWEVQTLPRRVWV